MTLKAILFDLDGTLLDTLQDIQESTNAALATLGFPGHDMQSYKYFLGGGPEVMAPKVLPPANRNPETINQLKAAIAQEYDKWWAIHTQPYPGIPALLDSLAAKNIKMMVLSNKPHDFTIACVAKFLSRWHFAAVVGASPSIPRKPDPTAALQIAGKLKLSLSDFLYPGDTEVDIQTALAAGMVPVGVAWGFRTADELLSAGAKTVIQHPMELLSLLDKQQNLRPMTKTDIDAVYDLVQTTINISYAQIYPREAIDFFEHHHSVENILKDLERGYIVVAELEGKIIGTGTLVGNSVRRVFVNPLNQGKGIGILVYKELERKAKADGFTQLTLDSSLKSRTFWASQGFVLVQEFAMPVDNGQNLIYFEMAKALK
jgi:phosphoglycolate phosphatase